ncbi:MAG TPA: bacteriohemerythrin [Spirochaetota bacterium]|mgnify:CR=1 FL=1|nr:bacteriohemerythrin [Spirochaetota bacterium]HOS39329.1 bacteriohemerythrin [Spirochaetota bacterium]HPU88270.1 bacteriohemerythrin [Spirochaetota bacterium]
MPFIVWTEDLSVGVKAFDEDHKQLVGYVNKLHLGMQAGERIDSMSHILDGLIDYTITHFKREQDLMAANSYPEYEDHKMQHEILTNRVLEFKELIKNGKSAFTIELMVFLRDWLTGHIKGSDMRYREFFTKKGIS